MKKKRIQAILIWMVSITLMMGTLNVQAANVIEENNLEIETEVSSNEGENLGVGEENLSDNMEIEDNKEEENDNIEEQESTEEYSEEAITVQTIDTQIVRPQEVTDLKAQVVNWNQVKLTWTESDAEGYIIYRKTSSQDKFSYCYMVKNGSFVDTKAERGNYNFYRVYPYNTDSSGKRILGKSTAYVYAKPGSGAGCS